MTPEEIRKQMMISAGLVGPKSSLTPAESSAPAEPETHVEVLTEREQVSEENSPIDDAVVSSQDNALEASPAEPSLRKKRKSKSASSSSHSLAKVESEASVALTKSEPSAAKPMNRIWLLIGIFFMGPIPLFFVSWKRALLSIFLLIITLGLPIAPALKFWLFWVGIPLLLVFTKKRS